MDFRNIFRFLFISLTTFIFVGCTGENKKFSEKDFVDTPNILCIVDYFEGSPLEGGAYILHYNEKRGLINLGSYAAPYSSEFPELLVHLYGTEQALVGDDSITATLSFDDSDMIMERISIDRKTLSLSIMSAQSPLEKQLSCELIEDNALIEKEKEFLRLHRQYKEKQDKENKI